MTIDRVSVRSRVFFLFYSLPFSNKNILSPLTSTKFLFLNSEIPLNYLADTEKSPLNIPSTHRKHKVKKSPFLNILSQLRFHDNLKFSKEISKGKFF